MAKMAVANPQVRGCEGFAKLGWARPIDLGHDITSYL
jgi:hypothetical protein